MNLRGEITGIKYSPFLGGSLLTYEASDMGMALENATSFVLSFPRGEKLAASWWVSPKRTRSYPYARVYDTLLFQGKKITIIPILKDEGADGDRDFLQWDTISLMSLFGVYVIISYYCSAEKNKQYSNKITKQRFDVEHIKTELTEILSYQSDALHWNLSQSEKVGDIGIMALRYYENLSKQLGVKMKSAGKALARITSITKNRQCFMEVSRKLASQAQNREVQAIQPKERLSGNKASLTITNYLGGNYYLTCDEARVENREIVIVESKHSQNAMLPSLADIKDALIKMMLFANLQKITLDNKSFSPRPVLKLTTNKEFTPNLLSRSKREKFDLLLQEANANKFQLMVNEKIYRIQKVNP